MARTMTNGRYMPKGPERAESGWISPTGNWWSVALASHYAFAAERVGDSADPCDVLERRGWLHVSGVGLYIGSGCEVSDAQVRTLMLLYPHWQQQGIGLGKLFENSVVELLGYLPLAT